jgi:condensin complex subunit 2
LDAKLLETELAVDPLFRKTCAEFDEGGAHGLLLNHLCMYGDGRMVFDAGDIDVKIHDRQDVANIYEDPLIYQKSIDISGILSGWTILYIYIYI